MAIASICPACAMDSVEGLSSAVAQCRRDAIAARLILRTCESGHHRHRHRAAQIDRTNRALANGYEIRFK